MALAGKGRMSTGTWINILRSKGWQRYKSRFLLAAIVINALGLIIAPLQEVFLSQKSIKAPNQPTAINPQIDVLDFFQRCQAQKPVWSRRLRYCSAKDRAAKRVPSETLDHDHGTLNAILVTQAFRAKQPRFCGFRCHHTQCAVQCSACNQQLWPVPPWSRFVARLASVRVWKVQLPSKATALLPKLQLFGPDCTERRGIDRTERTHCIECRGGFGAACFSKEVQRCQA